MIGREVRETDVPEPTVPHVATGQAHDLPPVLPAVIDAQALFGGAAEVRLMHRGMEYRLRITRQGKLILTK